MAEAFELVRIVRQHIRRSATLLDQGKLTEALLEADAALAIDPQSLPAQAMRERIVMAQAGAAAGVKIESSGPEKTAATRPFVPQGVNAASWRGFEQRITERRFKALLESVNTSIVAGDGEAARAALTEARELRPDAAVLPEFEARVAAVPSAAVKPAPRIWMRAMGAAALFLVGVSMLLGLEWMRPGEPPAAATQPTVTAPAVPVAAPSAPVVEEGPPAPQPDLGSVPVALNDDEETIPAVVTPPEPLLRPAGTSGAQSSAASASSSSTAPSRAPAPPPPAAAPPPRPAPAIANARPSGTQTAPEPRTAETAARSEVPDDFVAPRQALVVTPDAGPAVAPSSRAIDTPVSASARGPAAPAADAVAPAAIAIPSGLDQQTRVEEVLRRYARAYDQLDASAARAVWPSVDVRALARAFQNLSSQNVSLENCEIDIRGAVANASCRGQASYAPKVGNREPRTEARNWRFELRRDGDAWQIVDVEARRQELAYR